MDDDRTQPGQPPRTKNAGTVPARLHTTSAELFRGAREIAIEHDGRTYQLRITQNGKLILTA